MAPQPASSTFPASVSLESTVRIPQHVLFRNLAGELVLLSLSSGAYFSLDPVGTRMWHALQETGSIRLALTNLLQEFDVDETRLRHDVMELVSELVDHGLLELVASEPR